MLEALEKEGYSASRLRAEKLLSESAILKLRQGKVVGQPGDEIGMLWTKNDAFLPNEPIKPKVYILDRELKR